LETEQGPGWKSNPAFGFKDREIEVDRDREMNPSFPIDFIR
jgi:hypothetical protein